MNQTLTTYAQQAAAAIIADWTVRPRLDCNGFLITKTITLETPLHEGSAKELKDLLLAAGLDFELNQILRAGKIEKQMNIIHVFRAEVPVEQKE